MHKRIPFSMHPNVMSKQLGADMYSPPEALKQLVANALDANSSRVDIKIKFNELEAPEQVTIEDDGVGIAPQHLEAAMGKVGIHSQTVQSRRETIGTRGIGRFAVFSLGVQAFWKTVALANDELMTQEWVMEDGQTALDIEQQPASRGERPGTSIRIILRQTEGVKRLFQSVATVKRVMFNSFAGYLTRYEGEVDICVNDEPVYINDYIDEQSVERIGGSKDVPEGTLRHMVLSHRIDQPAPSILVFATHGTTIKQEVLGDEGMPQSSRRCSV